LVALAGLQAQFVKHQRRRLIERTRSLQRLQALSWREFEQLCAQAYRRQVSLSRRLPLGLTAAWTLS
jgi:hypothetical protein